MNFKSKFSFDQTVYAPKLEQQKTWIPCTFCGGTGKITGQDKTETNCPICPEVGGEYNHTHLWCVSQPMIIGEIRIISRYKPVKQDTFFKESYMCYETGIGSGVLWELKNLFETATEAQAACDALNDVKRVKRPQKLKTKD